MFAIESPSADIFVEIVCSISETAFSSADNLTYKYRSPHKSPRRRPNSIVVRSCICFCIASKSSSILSASHLHSSFYRPSNFKISVFFLLFAALVLSATLLFPIAIFLVVVFLLLPPPVCISRPVVFLLLLPPVAVFSFSATAEPGDFPSSDDFPLL